METLYTNLLEQLYIHDPFRPANVLTDFEKGLHAAVIEVLPGTTMIGCYFHRLFGTEHFKEVPDVGCPFTCPSRRLGSSLATCETIAS